MTKFFLFGGGLLNILKNTDFLNRLKFKNRLHNILVFPYAKEESEWQHIHQMYADIISGAIPETKVHIADKNIPELLSKINLCEMFIFSGGSEILFKSTLESLEINLEHIIRNKIIVGNSAGTNIFSEIYFSNNRDKVEAGYGICPIKTICHYDETKKSLIKLLQDFEPADLPIFPLRDEQFAEYEL